MPPIEKAAGEQTPRYGGQKSHAASPLPYILVTSLIFYMLYVLSTLFPFKIYILTCTVTTWKILYLSPLAVTKENNFAVCTSIFAFIDPVSSAHHVLTMVLILDSILEHIAPVWT